MMVGASRYGIAWVINVIIAGDGETNKGAVAVSGRFCPWTVAPL